MEENMAFGLYVMQDGSVMVAYGQRHIPISCAQYKANGYKPPLEKLAVKSPAERARIPQHAFNETDRLLARPDEAASPALAVANLCWRDLAMPGSHRARWTGGRRR